MAESSDGEERSEEPTSKRLNDSREKGQVPRSRELTTVAALLASGLFFVAAGESLMRDLMALMARTFTLDRNDAFDTAKMGINLAAALFEGLRIAAPLMALMVVIAIIASVALSGWNFSTQALQPKFDKLNPIKGLGKVFSWRGLIEMLKGLAKFILIATVGFIWLQGLQGEFIGLGREDLRQGLAHVGDLLVWAFIAVSASLILVTVIDVPFQLWDNKRQLKMTKQEVKEENKQSMGNPEIKGRQRQIQMQAAMQRMMADVPQADVVVTNPTHYAIALRYQPDSMEAPKVIAKGRGLIAARIREIATHHQVPILAAPPLARALYHSTELNATIPAGLYHAVAQVLAYVFHLAEAARGERPTPARAAFDDLPIPEDLRRDN